MANFRFRPAAMDRDRREAARMELWAAEAAVMEQVETEARASDPATTAEAVEMAERRDISASTAAAMAADQVR